MGSRLAALVAAAAVAALAPAALADRRTTAVLNLAGDPGAADAAQLRRALAAADGLAAVPAGDLSRALEGTLEPTPAEQAMAVARAHLERGIEAFERFESRRARAELDHARAALLAVAPSTEANQLLASIGFATALVHLRDRNNGLAVTQLSLVHRLDPERPPLDKVQYPPEVIAADRAARRRAHASPDATLTVSATFDGVPVYVDGARHGSTPATIRLSPGVHDVVVFDPQYQIASARLELDPKDHRELRLELQPRTAVERAQVLRATVARGSVDRETAREAARVAAELTGAEAVLVITAQDGGRRVAALDTSTGRLSFARPIDDQVSRLFGVLVPVARPDLVVSPGGDADEPAWYARPWGMAAISGGIIATTAALITLGLGDGEPEPRQWMLGP